MREPAAVLTGQVRHRRVAIDPGQADPGSGHRLRQLLGEHRHHLCARAPGGLVEQPPLERLERLTGQHRDLHFDRTGRAMPVAGQIQHRGTAGTGNIPRREPSVASQQTIGGRELQQLRGILTNDPLRAVQVRRAAQHQRASAGVVGTHEWPKLAASW